MVVVKSTQIAPNKKTHKKQNKGKKIQKNLQPPHPKKKKFKNQNNKSQN